MASRSRDDGIYLLSIWLAPGASGMAAKEDEFEM